MTISEIFYKIQSTRLYPGMLPAEEEMFELRGKLEVHRVQKMCYSIEY